MKIAMQDLFETRFGIYNHLSPQGYRPLASVAFHDAEDINQDSRLDDLMDRYHQLNIREYFGLTFVEFLELPTDIVAMMFEKAERWITKKGNDIRDIEKALGAAAQGKPS